MASNVRELVIKVNGNDAENSLRNLTNVSRLLVKELRDMAPGTEEFVKKSKQLTGVRTELSGVKDQIYGTETALQKATRTMGGFAAGMGIAFGVSTVYNFFTSASNAAKDFEKSLSSLASITGATGEDLKFYEEQARQIGATTTLSATQAVDAFTLIGSKKPELLQAKEALAAVTAETVTLAEAAGISLPEAAEAMTQALNKYDLPASDAARVADVLAASFKNGSVDIQKTSFELGKFGGIANAQKISIEQSAAAIQVVGKTVEESGTKLRNILLKLASGADETNPSIVGLDKALEHLGAQTLGTYELSKMFGSENAEAALQLIKNRSEIIQMTEKVKEQGTALEMASINTDNLTSRYLSMDSVISDLKIGIGQFINTAILPMINGFITFLLAIKELPNFIKENRELFIAFGVAVLSLNAANIAATASTLAHAAAEKGRAIATQATAVAQRVLNAAMSANPIGLIITMVGALIAVFVNLYRTNENVRAGIDALWSAAKAAFTGIKNEAMNILGGVGDLLAGIFTFDIDKIKEGLASLKGAGSEIAAGTVNAYKESYKNSMATANEEITATHQEGADSVVAVEEEKIEEIAAIEEEAAKERKARLKQEAEDRKKLQEDFAKKEVEAQKALEDLQLALMEEGTGKKLAKLQLDHQRHMATLDLQREEILANTAITKEEQDALLENYRLQEEAKDAEYKEKKKEIEEEEREIKLEAIVTDLEEEEAIKAEQLQNAFLNGLQTEREMEEARLALQKEYLQKRLAALEAAGQGETLQAQKLKNAILGIDKQIADGKIAEAQRAEDFKYLLQQTGFEAAKSFLALGLELLGEETKGRKAFATAMKAIEIGQVVMQGIKEVQAIWAGAATLGPIAGPIMGALQTGIAVARSGIAINKIRTAQYARGGATGTGKMVDMMRDPSGTWRMPDGTGTQWTGSYAKGGQVDSPSFGVIGEKGAEWVGPNWMLRSPKYANIFGYLEAERRRATPFATGGTTSAPPQLPQNSSATSDLQQFMEMVEKFEEMKHVMEDIRELIHLWPSSLRVVNDPRDILDGINVLNEIETDSRINR